MEVQEKLQNEVANCIECGLCTKNCSFLEKYDLNLADFSKRPDLAYNCFLCGDCERVCPEGIDGRNIAIMMREDSVEKNGDKIAEDGYSMLLKEKINYKFKNYKSANSKVVLFTGCNFPSFYPGATSKISEILKKYGIDTVYDCCGKPVSELGLKKEAEKIIENINNELKKREVEEVVMLCPNCYYFLRNKIDAKVVSIYKKLDELNLGKKLDKDMKIFMPCPDKEARFIFKDIEKFLPDSDESEENKKIEIIKAQCCGLGGCASAKEKEISQGFTSDAIEKGGDDFYVYCASCAGNFRRGGAENVSHILNEIIEIDEKPEKGIKSLTNRMKFKFKR